MKCKHWKIEELVDPRIHELLPEDLLWRLFDRKTLIWLDAVREGWGKPLLINTWHNAEKWKAVFGIVYRESGLRVQNTKTGAKLSRHKRGEGFDFKTVDPKDQGAFWEYLANDTTLGTGRVEAREATPSWTHGEPGGTPGKKPRIFRP